MALVGVYKVNIKEVNLKVYYDHQNSYKIGWFSIPLPWVIKFVQ
jgi:hypothetical protein